MIDIQLYRLRVGLYKHCPKGISRDKYFCAHYCSTKYPFVPYFIIYYYTYILYLIFYSLSICIALLSTLTNKQTKPNSNFAGIPLNNQEQLLITVRLHLAIITCFLCRRYDILQPIY